MRVLRSFVKDASLPVLAREWSLRRHGVPDGLPLPPERMMFTVISTRWAGTFLDSGKKIVDAMEGQLRESGLSLGQFISVLDFGCGCGRLTRQLPRYTTSRLYGCDYNPVLVEWCRENLRIGEFKLNTLDPPLPYDSSSFDFILARSVFTHLPEDGQIAWMRELHRVLRPGGVLYFTTHGEELAGNLSAKEQELFAAGELVAQLSKDAGRNICASFESRQYVEHNLLDGFRLVRFVPGTDEQHLRQDAYIVERL